MFDTFLLTKTRNYKLATAPLTICCRLYLFSLSFFLICFFFLYFYSLRLAMFVLAKIFSCQNIFYSIVKDTIEGGLHVIDYFPFWKTLEKSSENWYTLTNKHHLSHSTLHRLKHNKDVSTKTLNDLCRILDCDIKDIVRYIPSDKDQKL